MGTALAAAILASCGPKTLALPADPVDRAATCGVVAASEARSATPNVNAPLSLAAQGRIIHHALLAGAEGGEFSADKAAAVSRRMNELQETITEGKWKELKQPCQQAYPDAARSDVTLPGDRFDAQLGCDELADFMTTALASQEMQYGNELGEYHALQATLDQLLGPGLRSRAGRALADQMEARRKALAEIARAGSPVAVMGQCVARFG
jgi:hypothetical protein